MIEKMNHTKKILIGLIVSTILYGCSKSDSAQDIRNSEENAATITPTIEESSQEKIKNKVLAQECADKLGLNIEDFVYISKKPVNCSDPYCSLDKIQWANNYGELNHVVAIFYTPRLNRFGEQYKVKSYCGFDYPDYKLITSDDGRKTNEERESELKNMIEQLTK